MSAHASADELTHATGSGQATDRQDQERTQRIDQGTQCGGRCGRQGTEQAGRGRCAARRRPARNSRSPRPRTPRWRPGCEQARADLAAAVAAVVAGQARLDAQQAKAGQVVRDQYQQQTNLLPIALLVDPDSTEDLQTRLQWSTTLFDTAQAEIDRLTLLQRQLNAARARQAELEAKVAAARREAAANLKIKKGLEARAAAEEATVARLLRQRKAAEDAAAADVAQDKARYSELIKERASVERRIAARIAKAAAERKAAERAAAAEALRERQGSAATSKHTRLVSLSAPRCRAPATASPIPVPARITSAFGMRFHPVLRYWKLHDGTDFGAACGTPIRAPRAGRVAERYYNAGYGKRLMIDHGYVGGRYVTTGYNHASRYTVRVGQRVHKGQVIGYVGSTGFSTGCHLHLMVWLNGRLRNPMTWF